MLLQPSISMEFTPGWEIMRNANWLKSLTNHLSRAMPWNTTNDSLTASMRLYSAHLSDIHTMSLNNSILRESPPITSTERLPRGNAMERLNALRKDVYKCYRTLKFLERDLMSLESKSRFYCGPPNPLAIISNRSVERCGLLKERLMLLYWTTLGIGRDMASLTMIVNGPCKDEPAASGMREGLESPLKSARNVSRLKRPGWSAADTAGLSLKSSRGWSKKRTASLVKSIKKHHAASLAVRKASRSRLRN